MAADPPTPIPLVVLGGADPRASELPPAGRGQRPLAGPKGVRVHIDGRPLIECVLERFDQSQFFSPLYVAGPPRLYRPLGLSAGLIDVEGSFSTTIKAAVLRLRRAHPGKSLAFAAYDVLPTLDTLTQVMAAYSQGGPQDFFFPLIRTPDALDSLGASGWKPTYRLVPEPGEPAVSVLPGHLLIADPQALRLDLIYHVLDIAYRTRNRPLAMRRNAAIRGTLHVLLQRDLRRLLTLRAPSFTFEILRTVLDAVRRLKAGTLTRADLEQVGRKLLVTEEHREAYPDRRVCTPIIDGLSLALDFDTEEEARAAGGELVGNDG